MTREASRRIGRYGFCRDCFTETRAAETRCRNCGSPRVLRHYELDTLSIAHIDCDAFYAAVEKRDRPELRDKPVIIGGGRRGVVSTACYVARVHGVRSAMPMFKALKACPNAVIVKPDMAKYSRVGMEVRQAMQELTPLVEPLSIDEAFLDLSGTEKLHGDPPSRTLVKFADRIAREIGITVSVGLSYCKFLAKVASDLEKPRGFSVIGKAEALEFLRTLPVTKIWGVGPAFEARLAKDGITLIGQLQDLEHGDLLKRYGGMGTRLFYLSRGQDSREVEHRRGAKSVSHETTFNTDYTSADQLVPILRALSEKVSERLKAKSIAGRTIVLKLKDKRFQSKTRNKQLADPTQLAERIFRTALPMLHAELDGTAYRLLGVGVGDLEGVTRADPDDLIDVDMAKRTKAERAMDALRSKFGERTLETGYTFGTGNRGKPVVDTDGDDDENTVDPYNR